jgi:hypothetical protein
MGFKKTSVAIAILASASLVGCGGGSSGGTTGSTVSFVKWSAITPPQTVNMQGISTDASYTAPAPTFAVTNITDDGVDTSATASITYRSDGSISDLSITTQNGTFSWDDDGTDTIETLASVGLSEIGIAYDAAGSNVAIAADPTDASLNWEYQTFGVWETGRGTGSGTFGGISVGAPTAGSSIPTVGGSIFTGYTGGAYVDAAGTNDYITISDLDVNVDFINRQLFLTTTNTVKLDATTLSNLTTANNLNMTGLLTYAAGTNLFTGNLTATGGMTGTTTGQFYGPNAEELGGVFSLTGAGMESYAGAYGAK